MKPYARDSLHRKNGNVRNNAENPKEVREKLIDEYKKEFNNTNKAIELELVESVISPSQTRKKIIYSLKELKDKVKLGEKHGNIPL